MFIKIHHALTSNRCPLVLIICSALEYEDYFFLPDLIKTVHNETYWYKTMIIVWLETFGEETDVHIAVPIHSHIILIILYY